MISFPSPVFYRKKFFLFYLFTHFILMGFLNESVSAPTTGGFSAYGSPKYPPNFTHFEYTSPEAQIGGTLKLAVPGTFDSLNPFILTGIVGAGSNFVFSTLMTKSQDELSTIYPYVAESYDLAEDKLSITFTLRKDACFHDKTPITPEDVIFSFETLKHKGTPLFKNLFSNVTKVEKVGVNGVKFTFSTSKNRELPLILGINLPILSKAFYTHQDFSKPSLVPPLGSGPYAYGSLEPGRSLTLNRVQNWWGENLPVNKYRYNFDVIKFDYFRDSNVAFEAFKLGEIDFRQENVAKLWATAYTFPAYKKGLVIKREIAHQIPLGMMGFALNTRKPELQNPKVREAIGYALDFEWINKNLFHDSYTRHKSYFSNSPFSSSGLPSQEELKILEPFKDKLPLQLFKEPFTLPTTDGSGNNRENLKKAHLLLKKAGYEIRSGKLINTHTRKPLKLEIISNFPGMEKVALSFIKNLRAMGIEAKFRLLDSSQYMERVHSFDFDILGGTLIEQSNNPGNEQLDYWGSKAAQESGSSNLFGISDPVVDHLIELIITSDTYEELRERVHALDRVLLWGYYIVPTWSLTEFRFAYWNKFKYPSKSPLYDIGIETWWIDSVLEKKLQQALNKLKKAS